MLFDQDSFKMIMNTSKPTKVEDLTSLAEQIDFNDDGECHELRNLIELTENGRNTIRVGSFNTFDKKIIKDFNKKYDPLKARARLIYLLELFGCDLVLEKASMVTYIIYCTILHIIFSYYYSFE
jgi:hypothetical protein